MPDSSLPARSLSPPTSTATAGRAGSSDRQPRRRRPEARAGEIIAAGLAQFAEHGFANTRLEDVARGAGVAKSTLYLYFENKEALFRATVEAHVGSVVGDLTALVEHYDGDSETLLRQLLAKAYDDLLAGDNLCLLRIIIGEGERFPALRQAFYEAKMTDGLELLRGVIARGVASGEFRGGPAERFPRLLISPIMAASVWRMTFEAIEPVDMPAWIEAHLELLMSGLRA